MNDDSKNDRGASRPEDGPRDAMDTVLDEAVAAVRATEPADGQVREAAGRTLERLRAEGAAAPAGVVLDCAALAALIPEYLAHRLPPNRAVLLEDHARSCVACRKALIAARTGRIDRPATEPAPRARHPRPFLRIAAAAALVMVAAGAWFALRPFGASGLHAQVVASSGPLYRFSGISTAALRAGETVPANEEIRTGLGGTAVFELPDGSKIEAAERSSFTVQPAGDGTVIRLNSGNIIVEAAKQKHGHLYVQTDDAKVAVKGTIFAVNTGLKGSRVSVVEGEVHVSHGQALDVLHPGDQVSTSTALAPVPIATEVAWSRNVDRYVELLQALGAVGREIDQKVAWPGPHRSTELLDRVPADTIVYVSIPNAGHSLADAYDLLRERVKTSAVLSEWWQTRFAAGGHDVEVDRAIARLRAFSAALGEEVVVSLSMDGDSLRGPLVLAKIKSPGTFRAFLDQELADLRRAAGQDVPVRVIADADVAALPRTPRNAGDPAPATMLVWLHGDLLAAAFDAAPLAELLAAEKNAGSAASWAEAPFRQRLALAYQDGVDWLFGADVHTLVERNAKPGTDGSAVLQRTGLAAGRYVVVTQRTAADRRQIAAAFDFDGPRQGLAAWPAAPGTLGSIRFVSPDASLYGGVLLREPKLMLEDVYAMTAGLDRNAESAPGDSGGVPGDVRLLLERIAAPLGNEIGWALDGPALPVPAWKLVLEVYDPAAFQDGLEQLVAFVTLKSPELGLALTTESLNGVAYYTLASTQPAFEIHYAFADGYAVFAPRRAFVDRALAQRASGLDLSRAAKFRALVPNGADPNASGLFWHDIGGMLGPIAGLVGQATQGQMSEEQRRALREAMPQAGLAIVEAQPERIVVTAQQFGSLGSDLARVLSAFGSTGLLGLLHEGAGPGAVSGTPDGVPEPPAPPAPPAPGATL